MIAIESLTKRFGDVVAVDDLSFTVRSGQVTGFLGANGAGKSTTMRIILGLDRPSAGRATVNGKLLHEHPAPLAEMGMLLDAGAVHPKRSARNHLRALAASNGISKTRVDAVLEQVGLADVADRAAGGFSLGMGQRLGIASALLGDPETIMLDEPVNGLDPEGIRWIRGLLRQLADDGRTVFVSSHLMSEMALIAEHFVIIGQGRLIADVTATELEARVSGQTVRVRTPDAARLAELLAADGVGLLGVALGFLLRSTAGAIGVLFSGLLLVPGLAGLLPWSWATSFTKVLPSNAGDAFTTVKGQSDLLSPGVGLVVFVVWVVALLAAASVVLERRDA